MKRGKYQWVADFMNSPRDKAITYICIIGIIIVVMNASLYQGVLMKIMPTDENDNIDPEYELLVLFLSVDKTDENEYQKYWYTCINFAQDLSSNANKLGIRCKYVIIDQKDSDVNHAIVSFNTTDRGVLYVEPQTDKFLDPADFEGILFEKVI